MVLYSVERIILMSIPKLIHYCWLSEEPFPSDIKNCIYSWKNVLTGYDFKLWNTRNFDVNICTYTKQAMKVKKYAFVSDYIRLYAIYNEGGIYLDSDIEVFKSFDDLLCDKGFMGFESGCRVGAWLMAGEKGNPLFEDFLEYYKERDFINENNETDNTPNTVPITTKLTEYGLIPKNVIQQLENITVYPEDFFCPYNPWTGKTVITQNTYCKHLFKGAWNEKNKQDIEFIRNIPEYTAKIIKKLSDKKIKEIILYGLGVVGQNVLKEINQNASQIKISYIMVTHRDNEWKEICGIPIVEIDEDTGIDKQVCIVVATSEKYYADIKNNLLNKGYNNIYFLEGKI